MAKLGDSDPQVRCAAVQALERVGDPALLSRFLDLLVDDHFEVRLAAIKCLRRLDDPEIVPALIERLSDPDSDVRQAAVESIGLARDRSAIEPLILSLADEEPAVRHAAAAALENIDPRWIRAEAVQRAIPRLEAMRTDPQPWIAAAADQVLQKLRSAKDVGTEIWKRESGIRRL